MIKAFLPVFLPLVLLCGGIFYCNQKPEFGPVNIGSSLQHENEWEIERLSAEAETELAQIFAQNFVYLGAGSQSYAFLSDDGKYVLKFFRMKNFMPKPWYALLPPISIFKELRAEKIERQSERLKQLFRAYKLAYTELKEQTALIYLHLNKSDNLHQQITLVDKQGKSHRIDLDKFEFVLQKRADTLLYDYLLELWNKGEKKQVRNTLNALIDHVRLRSQKGIADRDDGLKNNFGFTDGNFFQLDPGRLYKNDALPAEAEAELLQLRQRIEQEFAFLKQD